MKSAPSVTAAMIVRNEEAFLGDCLESLLGAVDDIVIVDTGSKDRTCQIADRPGVRLLHHVWQDDFAKARNVALDAVRTDWVLYIDADERLVLPRGGRLGSYINPAAVTGLVKFRPKTGYTRYREWRLFRSDPRIRFEGRIHETMLPGIMAVLASDGGEIDRPDVDINHLGYDGDQSHKHGRNIPLLEAGIRTNPQRVYYWYHLAESLMSLGRQDEAERIAEQGLQAALQNPSEKQRVDSSLIVQILVRIRFEKKRDALDLLDFGLERVPEDYALQFMRCRALLDAGQMDKSLAVAKSLLAVDPDQLCEGLMAFDRSIFREKACELAAIASLRLGQKAQAAGYFAQAAAYAPHIAAYALKAAALGGAPARMSADMVAQ